MISPAWAAAFASPPAAMALAMAAAGVGGGEASHRIRNSETFDRRSSRLLSFATFQKPSEAPTTPTPLDKAATKAAALAAARDQERAARVGSVRGLGAVAMATSGQRRNLTDKERAKRWNISEAMGNVWLECDNGGDYSGKDPNGPAHRMFGTLPTMMEGARRLRMAEVDFLATTLSSVFGMKQR